MMSIRANRNQVKALRLARKEAGLKAPKSCRKLNQIHKVIPKALSNKEKGLNKAGKPLARISKKPRM